MRCPCISAWAFVVSRWVTTRFGLTAGAGAGVTIKPRVKGSRSGYIAHSEHCANAEDANAMDVKDAATSVRNAAASAFLRFIILLSFVFFFFDQPAVAVMACLARRIKSAFCWSCHAQIDRMRSRS